MYERYTPDYIYYPLIYSLLFIILCFIVKPMRNIPMTIWRGLGDLLSAVVEIPLLLFQYVVAFLKETLPTLFEHLLKLILALLLFLVRGITWALQALVRILHSLFQKISS